jgi:hypothetical protein
MTLKEYNSYVSAISLIRGDIVSANSDSTIKFWDTYSSNSLKTLTTSTTSSGLLGLCFK